ncbi:hypothetical protein SAMN05421834_1381 [Halanaerobium kushneri]|uniref:Uncharacterized protein n=1 Tax=Halanaerobium kushneri TaxID=56779 RepID=A0A1N7C0D1_9FIRM|nr:hypothetical protein SAMN05421834_1381 [Halanaerobium kushneri]
MLILQAFYWNCLDDWWEEIKNGIPTLRKKPLPGLKKKNSPKIISTSVMNVVAAAATTALGKQSVITQMITI